MVLARLFQLFVEFPGDQGVRRRNATGWAFGAKETVCLKGKVLRTIRFLVGKKVSRETLRDCRGTIQQVLYLRFLEEKLQELC